MKYKSNYPHGIMFHHFHDLKYFKKSQGSISSQQFEKIISIIGRKNIINADEFLNLYLNKKLNKNHVCLTFDDGLKCQIDIALPILKKYNIKAFWFLYTSIFDKKFDYLEIFREFRHSFKTIDIFYEKFFSFSKKLNIKIQPKKLNYFIKNMEKKFPFYSKNDLKFRYYRDQVLKKKYIRIMMDMMNKSNFSIKKVKKKIYMNRNDLKKLKKYKQIIGLHSHSHPTNIDKLSIYKSKEEYKTNKKFLEKLLKNNIISMSHPCGNYNLKILEELQKLKMKIGFNSNIKKNLNYKIFQNYQIPREDHSNIINTYL
tara:strand:- start:532 stop:1470 length:939 start_codon:yes stop_codon:yes gene_type:complete